MNHVAPNDEDLYRLYSGKRFAVLQQLLAQEPKRALLATMLSAYALRSGEQDLASRTIPHVMDGEERLLKQKTLTILDSLNTPLDSEPRVHLLILTYNREDFVTRALQELAATDYSNYAVYILDNGSTDRTWEIVSHARQFFPSTAEVHVERMPCNTGRPVGHNLLLTGHDHSNADFIAIGDDDLISVPQDWLKKMIQTAKLFPNAAVIGGKALSPGENKNIQCGVRRLLRFTEQGLSMSNDGHGVDVGQMDYIDHVDQVIGCLHIYKAKTLFEKIGLFDIRFSPCQCVDLDHHFRARLLGYDVIYNGLIEFVHARAMGNNVAKDKALQGNSMANMLKILKKYDVETMENLVQTTAKCRREWMQNTSV